MTPVTVLISDDEAAVGRSLQRSLQRRGIRVVIDLESDVVAVAEREQPALILLDYMQRIDGAELLQALKQNAATAHIPILVITAVDEDERRRRCMELGAEGFVSKPFPDSFVEELVARVGPPRPAP
jgi:CheY-like chemotaxis protein